MPTRLAQAYALTKITACITLLLLLAACTVGPNYLKPTTKIPEKFKEASKGWKIAEPQDELNRGAWWTVFKAADLDSLEAKIDLSNQTIAVAQAQYLQAKALVDQAQASLFPVIGATASNTRQKTVAVSATQTLSGQYSTTDVISLTATWEPDLWGGVRRLVEANQAAASASAALLAGTRLSMQASLAQYYFQLRALDVDQQYLDNNLFKYQQLLALVQNQYAAGVASRLDILQADNQLKLAKTQALDNGILRAQYEHAIAVLLGQPPAHFSIKPQADPLKVPHIPIKLPSALLERRPDIAAAERQVAQANAEIGIAIAGFFPNLTLTSADGIQSNHFSQLLSKPITVWSLGSQLAATLFDSGLNSAKTAAARANYDAQVATYRQTVLSAFQDVEDNLANLRILEEESNVLHEIVITTDAILQLTLNQYKSGINTFADVLTAQLASDSARKNLADTNSNRTIATVALIKALGGGWK